MLCFKNKRLMKKTERLSMIYVKNAAFTLAEVLITLLIVGVIASIVIPGLIQDSKNAELKAAYKKSFSDLSQATNRILQDNGGILTGLCPQNDTTGATCWKNQYKSYLSVVKECENGKNIGNCWPDMGGGKGAKYFDGTEYAAYTNWWSYNAGLVLNNGTSLAFLGSSGGVCDKNYTSASRCFHFWVDVNGIKPPNTFGKDVFYLQVNANRLYPVIGFGEACSGEGFNCATSYLKDN